MSDLTNRLRAGLFDQTGSIRDEAADEIERLTARVVVLEQALKFAMWHADSMSEEDRTKCLAALKGEAP